MKQIVIQQGSQDWHNLRRNSIGSSDASVIMGLNPWKSELDLFNEKLGLSTSFVNNAMRRGMELEPYARAKISSVLGMEFTPMVIQSEERSWQIASLDGITDSGVMVEIKCGGNKLHSQARNKEIPSYYMAQMQHQLSVAEKEKMYYFSFDGEEGVILDVYRDDEYIKKLNKLEEKFRQRVLNIEPPEEKYDERTDSAWMNLSFEVNIKKHQVDRIKQKLKEAEQDLNDTKDQLIALAGGKSCRGGGISLCHIVKPGPIDYKAIPELKSVNLEQYRKKPIEYWTLN